MLVSLWTMFRRHWFWPVLALCLLYVFMMIWPGGKWKLIEQDVVELTQKRLVDAGLSELEIHTENRGRDVLISGVVVSEEEKNKAIALAESVADQGGRVAPRTVEWKGTIQPPKPVPLKDGELRIGVDANNVLLSGVLSSQQEIDNTVSIAKNTYYDRTINNQLTLAENIKPFSDIAAFFKGFNTREGALFIRGNKVALNGEVDRTELKKSIGDQVLLALGPDYTLDNNIKVVEPIIVEPTVVEPELVVPEENRVCQEQLEELMQSTNIYFETNRADIKTSSLEVLNRIANVLSQCPAAEIEVAGHTDSLGGDELNLSLSQRRAESVVDFLTLTAKLENKIAAVGYGETSPVADNSTKLGRAKNRRIEFIVK